MTVAWSRCGDRVSGFGLSNWRDGGPLSSVLINKYLGQMDIFVVLITGKATSLLWISCSPTIGFVLEVS